MMTIMFLYMLKNLKNVNSWLIYSIRLDIEILDVDYKDIDSVGNLDITDTMENILRIMRYRMYLIYSTGGRNARKKRIK